MESAESLRCALAARARGITKTRTVQRGRRTMEKMRSATVQNAQPQKSFLLRTDKRRERRGRCEKLGDGDRHRSRGGDSATCFAT